MEVNRNSKYVTFCRLKMKKRTRLSSPFVICESAKNMVTFVISWLYHAVQHTWLARGDFLDLVYKAYCEYGFLRC